MILEAFKTIEKYKMLDNTDKIIIGLSGGADSVALTHFLNKISEKRNFEIVAVHVNHGIRGEEAERDENFVKEFCKSLSVKLLIKKVNVIEIAKSLRIGIEEAGRKTRYEIFKEVSKEFSNFKIATAHTLSDNAETIIMRLIGGTSLKGLCGIPPVRENIIRPLINIKRSEIEAYCKENNLKYVNDSSNYEKDYTRNKIRLDIIPKFKMINLDFENSIRRAVEALQEDNRYLEDIAKQSLEDLKIMRGYDSEKIQKLPPAIKNRIILKILNSFTDKRIEQKHLIDINKIIESGCGKICIPGNKVVVCEKGILKLQEEPITKNVDWEYLIKPLNVLTEVETTIIIDIVNISEYELLKKGGKLRKIWGIDFEKLPEGSVLRNKRPGDKFTFPFRNITKSVKKIFNEMKIPQSKRNHVPILACSKGIIWIDEIGVSKYYMPSKNTKKVAVIFRE